MYTLYQQLLRFSFWGAGSTNYGNELLELACLFIKEYPKETRIALMNNWLVNPSGLPGHWHELDLLMEHFNHWLKRLLVKKTLDFDSPFMKNTISLNLSGFQRLRETFPTTFGLKKTAGSHPDADRSADINRLGNHYRSENRLKFVPGRRQGYVTEHDFLCGYEKLQDGQLATFLARTASQAANALGLDDFDDNIPGTVLETDNCNEESELNSVAEPSEPIVMENGTSTLSFYTCPASAT